MRVTFRPMMWFSVVSALLEAGCAALNPQPDGGAMPVALGGSWTVAESYSSGPDDGKTPPLGRVVIFGNERVFDASGRVCAPPRYRVTTAARSQVFGFRENDQAGGDAPTQTIEVLCGTHQPFLTLVEMKGGVLLMAEGSRWLRLERTLDTTMSAPRDCLPLAPLLIVPHNESAVPVDNPPPASSHASASSHVSEHPAPPAPESAAAAHHLYLASYRDAAGGQRAWELLTKVAPELAALRRVILPVDVPKRGRFVRLYAAAASDQSFNTICRQVRSLARDCGAIAMRWK